MADRNDAVIALLTRIADGIERLVSQQQKAASAGAVASDKDLDGKYGDPQVRMRVKDWTGPDLKGRKFSQCPAEFLDLYAETLEWAAGKDEDSDDAEKRKYAKYKRTDAARARGWAKRIREGKVPATKQTPGDDDWGHDGTGAGW